MDGSTELTADGMETISAAWVNMAFYRIRAALLNLNAQATPREALDACMVHRETILFPPQIYLLAELAKMPFLSDVKEHAKRRTVVSYLPLMKAVRINKDQVAYLHPADDEYTDERKKLGVRHRTYVGGEKLEGDVHMRAKQPLQVLGLHRRNVEGLGDIHEGQIHDEADPVAMPRYKGGHL